MATKLKQYEVYHTQFYTINNDMSSYIMTTNDILFLFIAIDTIYISCFQIYAALNHKKIDDIYDEIFNQNNMFLYTNYYLTLVIFAYLRHKQHSLIFVDIIKILEIKFCRNRLNFFFCFKWVYIITCF